MLWFQDLTTHLWNELKEVLLSYEDMFPEKIKYAEKDYLDVLEDPQCLAKAAMLDNKCIGVIIASPLSAEEQNECEMLSEVQPGSMYIYKFVISPEHQNKGFGKKLLTHWIECAISKGVKQCLSHFRLNGSAVLIKRFGAVEKKRFANWEGGEDEYVFCELDLTKPSVQEQLALINKETEKIQVERSYLERIYSGITTEKININPMGIHAYRIS